MQQITRQDQILEYVRQHQNQSREEVVRQLSNIEPFYLTVGTVTRLVNEMIAEEILFINDGLVWCKDEA